MSIGRIVAVAVIFGITVAGWTFLGATTQTRSKTLDNQLSQEIRQLWGIPLRQQTPTFSVQVPGNFKLRRLMPASEDVQVDLKTDYRKKGLLWYPTFTCAFKGTYTVNNPDDVAQKVRVHFGFPAPTAPMTASLSPSTIARSMPLSIPIKGWTN